MSLEPARYRCRSVRAIAIDADETLLSGRHCDVQVVVPRAVAACLPQLASSGSAAQLGARVAPALGPELAAEVIAALIDAEVLVPIAGVDRGVAAAPRAIELVAIPTCDRPELLARCLDSWAGAVSKYRPTLRLAVFDDSPPAGRDANRAVAESRARAHGIAIEYVGAAEKRALAAGVDREIAEFALADPMRLGYTLGANRNAILLYAGGRGVLVVDDDTLAHARDTTARAGLRLSAAGDPTRVEHFASAELARAAAGAREVDPFAAAERLLGLTLAQARGAAGALDVDPGDRRIDRLLERDGGRIIAGWLGFAGDAGGADAMGYLCRGPSFSSDDAYQRCFASRRVKRSVDRWTVGTSGFWIAPATAYDTSARLPPFVPALRCSDNVWGPLAMASAPDALLAYAPCVVPHEPGESRANDRAALLRAAGPGPFASLVLACIDDAASNLRCTDVDQRMARIGQHLRDVAALSEGDRADYFAERLGANHGRLIGDLERRLAAAPPTAPGSWRDDSRAFLAAARRALEGRSMAAPIDLASGRVPELLAAVGQLLEAWPTMLAVSKGR